jgi:hypothetical protein
MISPDLDLRRRARRAYEHGRWHHGLRDAWPALLLVPLALALHGPAAPLATALSAALLAAALVTSSWRGGAWRRGALVGVVAGLPMFLAPSFLMPTDADCGMACARAATPWLTCFTGCAMAALTGGLVVGLLARRDRAPLAYAAGAGIAAVLTASMTCTLAGAAGILGAAAGLAAASVPVVAGALRRA